MKRPFNKLEIEVFYFNNVDVLTASTDKHDVWGDDPYEMYFQLGGR